LAQSCPQISLYLQSIATHLMTIASWGDALRKGFDITQAWWCLVSSR
jgi:hypothetical protein